LGFVGAEGAGVAEFAVADGEDEVGDAGPGEGEVRGGEVGVAVGVRVEEAEVVEREGAGGAERVDEILRIEGEALGLVTGSGVWAEDGSGDGADAAFGHGSEEDTAGFERIAGAGVAEDVVPRLRLKAEQ
jgi:hypothetical protein